MRTPFQRQQMLRFLARSACSLLAVFCLIAQASGDSFDYHKVRGRQPIQIAGKADEPSQNPSASAQPERVLKTVQPLTTQQLLSHINHLCLDCHGGENAESDVRFDNAWSTDNTLHNIGLAQKARNALARRQMPPEDAESHPSPSLRRQLVATLDQFIADYLAAHPSHSPIVMRRLNRYEYNNAVRDLLDLKGDIYPLPEKTIRADESYFDPSTGRFPESVTVGNRTLGKNQVEKQVLTGVSPFAIDLQAEGGFNNRGDELSVSPILLESFIQLGRSIVQAPEFEQYCRRSNEIFAAPNTAALEKQSVIAKRRLERLLERAFRQPITESTLTRYHTYFLQRREFHGNFTSAMKDVVAAILASPNFIYIAERSPSATRLSAWELATRLSFFLWSTIPDRELLDCARNGSLLRNDVLHAQVKRMLEHPRSQAISQNFARQWLRLDQLITAVPDFDRFERYYSRIGCEQWKFGLQTMIEPLLLFESILVEDRSIMLLIDSNYAYRSNELQSWYRDEVPFDARENRNRFNTNQQHFRRRQLEDRREGGVITTAAALTMTSAPLRTSPIVRGAWVATVIFNQPPPPPPDEVPQIEADDKTIEAKGLTLRQRLVQHQENQTCASCHARIDPLGFALENYDAVGRWRDTYQSGLAIDASGKLFGEARFDDVIGMKDVLLEQPEWFTRAFVEHMLSYALSRKLTAADTIAVDQITSRALADHGRFSTIVHQIVDSHSFRHRVNQVNGPIDSASPLTQERKP